MNQQFLILFLFWKKKVFSVFYSKPETILFLRRWEMWIIRLHFTGINSVSIHTKGRHWMTSPGSRRRDWSPVLLCDNDFSFVIFFCFWSWYFRPRCQEQMVLFESCSSQLPMHQPKAIPSHLHIRPCWQQVTQPLLPATEEFLTPTFCLFKHSTSLGGMQDATQWPSLWVHSLWTPCILLL